MFWLMLVMLFLGSEPLWAGAPTKMKSDIQWGRDLYRDNCQSCHGVRGLGDGPLSAVLPSPALAGRSSSSARPAAVSVILNGRGDMPGFSTVLEASDARRVLVWLETLDPQTGLSRPGTASEEEPGDEETEGEGGEGEGVGG